MKKRFKCTVERTEEYIIEFDDEIINQEWLDEFAETIYKIDSLKEHAEHLAQHRARFEQNFIEGYGVPLIDGEIPYTIDKNNIQNGINIIIVSEDEMCDVDVEEIR